MRQVARHAGLAGSAVRQVACDITSVAELQVENAAGSTKFHSKVLANMVPLAARGDFVCGSCDSIVLFFWVWSLCAAHCLEIKAT